MAEAAEQLEDQQLLERIGDIARMLAEADGLDATLQLVVDLSEGFLTNCDGASMMLVRGKHPVITPAYSSEVAHESDLAQYEVGEGPCLGAMAERHTLMIDDLETDRRWPRYRERALELGVRSMLSLRLFVADDTMGALDLYSRSPHAFTDRSKLIGQVFASHASVAMKAAIETAGLEAALASRDVIGQAKGMLAEREGLSPSEAFARLRELSNRTNTRVHVLAERIVTTGRLPD